MADETAPSPRTWRRRAVRFFLWSAGILVLLAVLLLGGAWLYFRSSLPEYDGTITVVGTTAPIEIVRDGEGIPHIFAQNEADALFGLGYVHAQDRIWQMEWQRRIARATLSEVVGEPALETDRFLRTLGVYRAAQSAYDALDPETKALLDAYTAGINNYLATHSGSDLPPEFTLVGVKPTEWTGADVLGWSKMMAWDLGGNYSNELFRTDLIKSVGLARADNLMQRYPADGVTITSAALTDAPVTDLLALQERMEQQLGIGLGITGGTGSNNWVVGPSKSASGKPLLADDPHLGLRTPSIWYLAVIHGGKLNVAGATIPGLPTVLVGHNERIAWGVTNLGPDVQDLYRERLDPSGTQAEYNGQFEPLTIITETIAIDNQAPISLTVRISRHGPLISDALNANNADEPDLPVREALAFRWTALEPTDTTLKAYLGINLAQNWDEFTGAMQEYVAPSQNFVFADVDGNFGYYAPGNIPIRGQGTGDLPAEGWNPAHEWVDYVPFEQLPHAYNPPAGFIATANNKPVPNNYPYFLGQDWAASYRAERITALLESKPQLTVADMQAIQADHHSLYAEQLTPLLLQHTQPANDRQRTALELLKNWDYSTQGASAPAAIFEVWAYYILPPLLNDELGEQLLGSFSSKNSFSNPFLISALADPNNPWCDNITTQPTEPCSAILQESLEVALQDLEIRTDKADPHAWRWDQIHIASLPHSPMDGVNGLRGFFSQAIPNGGDSSTVNVAAVNSDQPFDQTHGPALRTVMEVGVWNSSQFIITPGQSGHPMSATYSHWLERWQRVEYVTVAFDRATVDATATATLRLEPGAAQ